MRATSPVTAPRPYRRRAGRLLPVLVLSAALPLLASCGLLGSKAKATTSSPNPGKTWYLYAQGSPSTSPIPAPGGGTSTTASATPVHPTYTQTYTWAAGDGCPGRIHDGHMQGLTVTTGSGTATVSWYNAQGSKVFGYHVSAVSQHLVAGAQPSPPVVAAAPGVDCQLMSKTITGLHHGEYYIFWLDAVVALPDSIGISNRVRDYVIGGSTATLVP